jgi:hypothetical protein
MTKYDGGQAFPGVIGEAGCGNSTREFSPDGQVAFVDHAGGMSLRAWLAGTISAGIRASDANLASKPETVARMAVADADALLAELEK